MPGALSPQKRPPQALNPPAHAVGTHSAPEGVVPEGKPTGAQGAQREGSSLGPLGRGGSFLGQVRCGAGANGGGADRGAGGYRFLRCSQKRGQVWGSCTRSWQS